MQLSAVPFFTTDFTDIESTVHEGLTGEAVWKTIYINDNRVRLVNYSANYEADHWCSKGHIIYCIEGEMEIELEDGNKSMVSRGMMCSIGDHNQPHKAHSKLGCSVFIVD